MNRPNDCLQAMFEELRTTIPPLPALLSDADARQGWLSSVALVIGAMKKPAQQWAALTVLAQDLVTTRYPDLPLALAYGVLAEQCGLTHVLAQVQAEHLKQALEQEEQP